VSFYGLTPSALEHSGYQCNCILGAMHVNILDPGLLGGPGHHFEWDIKLLRELTALGHDVCLYSHADVSSSVVKNMVGGAQLIPLFRVSPYLSPEQIDPIAGELSLFIDGANALADDLRKVRKADIWLWPSIFSSQILACALVRPGVPISGCIHVEPTYQASCGRMQWRYGLLKSRENRLAMNLGVVESMLQQEFSSLMPNGKIECFPIASDGVPTATCKTTLKTIGFFGHQRSEKGAMLLPALIPLLLTNGYQVVVHDSGDMIKASNAPGLTVLGYVPNLGEEIAKCDLVVTPYDATRYRSKGSGIVWDALASGVPVLAPRATAPGQLVETTGAGRLFDASTQESVLNSIRMVARDYSTVASAAFAVSQTWRNQHGSKRFAAAMLSAHAGRSL
jgi:glycosyltransferase involved in cell wall biosynthesis